MSGTKARSDAPVADSVSGAGHSAAAPQRDRKTGGGLLKRLKSRRSQVDSRPVTEEDLRTQGVHITPEDVLGLRVATRGLSPSVLNAPPGPFVAFMLPGHNDIESPQHQQINVGCAVEFYDPGQQLFIWKQKWKCYEAVICVIWAGNRRHEATFDSWKNLLFHFNHHQGDGKWKFT